MSDSKHTVLVIDAGNTSTSIGLYRSGRILRTDRLPTDVRSVARMTEKLKRLAGTRRIDGAILASVVPAVNGLWRTAVKKAWPFVKMMRVNHRLKLGVRLSYPKPGTLGEDRLANICAAAELCGTPVIVADFGTAATFNVVLKREGFIGGVIAPGPALLLDYLADRTAQLPRIAPGPIRHSAGKSSVEAMRMGARWGYRGLVREILKELQKATGSGKVALCATGGHAQWALDGAGIKVKINPVLTLQGLGRLYELNV